MSQIGVTGLAVMGANLARNIARRGVPIAVHNRTAAKTRDFMSEFSSEGDFTAAETLEEFVAALERPRRIIVMVKAGAPVDGVIADLAPLLDKDDIIIDAGNSHFQDTRRREQECAEKGLRFIGTGVSGGEEGALNGPSIMPGGPRTAYAEVEEIFTTIAAQVDGEPCCAYIGADGAGHYVKMVHNGVEYGMMQAYAEGFDLMHQSEFPIELKEVAGLWNRGSVVRSWLCELAERAFEQEGNDLKALRGYVDDSGEGRWMMADGIEMAVPTPALAASLFARFYSRQEGDYAARVLAALRNQFGGHAVKKVEET